MIRLLVLALAIYGVCAGYERVVRGPQACIGAASPLPEGGIR
jgi:hypothetical protein